MQHPTALILYSPRTAAIGRAQPRGHPPFPGLILLKENLCFRWRCWPICGQASTKQMPLLGICRELDEPNRKTMDDVTEEDEEEEPKPSSLSSSERGVLERHFVKEAEHHHSNKKSELESSSCLNSLAIDHDDDEQHQVAMDPQLWSSLPEDILDRVLAWLPTQSLIRARTVCKRWSSIMLSKSFLATYSNTPCRDSWILMFADPHYKSVFVCMPTSNKWLNMPLNFLPAHVDNVTVAGGLLCFRMLDSNGSSSMCICNPLTRSWRKLPPMIGRWCGNLVGMVVDEHSPNYKIVVQTKHMVPYGLRTEVFDSCTNLWSITGASEANFTTGSAFCNGHLYFMTWEAHNGEFICDGVYSYNLEQGIWSRALAPMPYFYICPHLVECGGHLLMIGGFWEQPAITVGIRVWELKQTTLEWVVVENMPQHLFKHLLKRPGYRLFNCVGHGELIYLSECLSPQLFVVFDFPRRRWYQMDTCPPGHYRATFSWFSFRPRLDAQV